MMRLALWIDLLILGGLPFSRGKDFSSSYSFLASRESCDGQCVYCKESGDRHQWSDIQQKLSRYVYSLPNISARVRLESLTQADYSEIQRLIDWSWQTGVNYKCIVGIIALRLLSYGFADPMQFSTDTPDFSVLDFLDDLNTNTGALDMLTANWASILAGGWPMFRELLHASRKVKAYLLDPDSPYSMNRIKARPNECDALDTDADREYSDRVRASLEDGGQPLPLSDHLHALWRGPKCPLGMGVVFLSIALHLIGRGQYQGSLKDNDNHVLQFIAAAQNAIVTWCQSKINWAPFFDMLSSHWPFWEVLSELACINTERSCVSRSAWKCFDMAERRYVQCPHEPPKARQTFTACGEHDICTWPVDAFPSAEEWCVPFDRRPVLPREPWLRTIGHDAEERICSQCGQDGVLQEIFSHVGFRDAVGPAASGGRQPFFVEFGARKPDMLNSAVLRRFCSWDGVLLDSQPGETPHGGCPGCPGIAELVRTEFVTAENVVSLFGKHFVPTDFDLLTIDTDYNDYWILKALLLDGTFQPRVIAVDFNPDIPLSEAKVVKYEALGEWDGTVYTVASLLAYALLARAHGYIFAYALEMGAHAFFIRKDLLADEDHELPLRNVQKNSHPPDKLQRQFVDVLYDIVPRLGDSASDQSSLSSNAKDIGTMHSEIASTREEVRSLVREVRALRSMFGRDVESLENSDEVANPPPKSQGTPSTGASYFYDGVRGAEL